jgi:hypothetical protein
MFDWDALIVRLDEYPSGMHRLLPPCTNKRIQAVEQQLGRFPQVLVEMLQRFNGGKLFGCPNAHTRLFGISTDLPLPPMEWAEDYYIDKLTPKWRAARPDRRCDWAIGVTGFGGLILLSDDEKVSEWDTLDAVWLQNDIPFTDWLRNEMREGDITLAELAADEAAGRIPSLDDLRRLQLGGDER